MTKWQREHPDEWKAYQKSYRAEHRQELLAYQRVYCAGRSRHCVDCGQSIDYRATRCNSCAHIGSRSRRWRGGVVVDARGYRHALRKNHPYCDRHGYVLEHRLVLEATLGRPLLPTEVGHHINGKVDDNRPENLSLFESDREHRRHHQERRG